MNFSMVDIKYLLYKTEVDISEAVVQVVMPTAVP